MRIRFAGTTLAVEHEGEVARRLVDLLFERIDPGALDAPPKVTISVRAAGVDGATQLSIDGTAVMASPDAGQVAEHLHERVAYHFADGCRDGLIVHAGAVALGSQALVFPAQSGSGKSTLTAWLMTRGFAHMTDELVHLSTSDARVQGWMRPLGVKHGSLALIEPLLTHSKDEGTWLDTPFGAVLSPRLLSSMPSVAAATVSALVFPRYEAGRAETLCRPLTKAEAAALLLRCTLNARHLPVHGLTASAALCRRVPGFELVYGSLDGLDELLRRQLARQDGL